MLHMALKADIVRCDGSSLQFANPAGVASILALDGLSL